MSDPIIISPEEEDIRRFMSLSTEERLLWLEETKEFVFGTMAPENRRIWESLQGMKSSPDS